MVNLVHYINDGRKFRHIVVATTDKNFADSYHKLNFFINILENNTFLLCLFMILHICFHNRSVIYFDKGVSFTRFMLAVYKFLYLTLFDLYIFILFLSFLPIVFIYRLIRMISS